MKKRNRSITADLTPLLDVIFILLFLIMIRNTEAVDARTAEAEEKLEEANAQMAEAQALQDAVQSELEEYQALLQDATICYIQIIGEESGRSIQLSENSRTDQFHFDWDTQEDAWQYLKERLAEKMLGASEGKQVFLIFQYDAKQLYQSDYDMVRTVLEEAGHTNNVYVQYRTAESIEGGN